MLADLEALVIDCGWLSSDLKATVPTKGNGNNDSELLTSSVP